MEQFKPERAIVPGTSHIFMTGGTSGLGQVAAQRLLETGARVWMAARSQVPAGATGITTDLSELSQATELAAEVEGQLGDGSIDVMVLNAGGYAEGRSQEGYDKTFVLNYLSHYVLIEKLWPRMAEGSRIIMTTSGTHDPAEQSRAPAPHHANAMWLAYPERDPVPDSEARTAAARAYATAKLCVVLHARALAARAHREGKNIQVYAYDPGPTPGTGLARGLPVFMRILWERFPGLIRWMMRKKANTIDDAGEALAGLALGQISPANTRIYAALRRGQLTWPPFSIHASQDDLMVALEKDSATLTKQALS